MRKYDYTFGYFYVIFQPFQPPQCYCLDSRDSVGRTNTKNTTGRPSVADAAVLTAAGAAATNTYYANVDVRDSFDYLSLFSTSLAQYVYHDYALRYTCSLNSMRNM